jgi:hypothetical protein
LGVLRINRRALFAPCLYLSIVTIVCVLGETDLRGGEQFIPVFLLGLPWTMIFVPLTRPFPTGPDHPIISRLVLFFFFVVLCGGINSYLLYAAVRAFQRFSGEDIIGLNLK